MEKLHLALVENLWGILIDMVPLQTFHDSEFVRVKVEHVVEEVVDGTPDKSKMRIHARQADRTIRQKRDERGNITKDSHIAVLHNIGAVGTLGPDQFGYEPSFQDESLELLLEAGDVTISLPELREFRRDEFGHRQLTDTEISDGRILDPGLRDQKNLRVRVENPHMLDGMTQVAGYQAVMIKKKCEIVVQWRVGMKIPKEPQSYFTALFDNPKTLGHRWHCEGCSNTRKHAASTHFVQQPHWILSQCAMNPVQQVFHAQP